MVDGDTTRREQARQTAAEAVQQVRDRRRRVRNRLEDIFGRKQFMGVVVAGSMGKAVETGVVPFLDPTASIPWGRLFAWLVVFALSVIAAVYWERLAKHAEAAGDAVEDAVDPD